MTDTKDGVASWRLGLAPGERHGFWDTPGWWDARNLRRDEEDLPALRMNLIWALPPLPDGCRILDLGAGTGNLVLTLASFYPHVLYTLIDGSQAALTRAEEKLSRDAPTTRVTYRAESVDPASLDPLVAEPCRLVVSTIALHDIVPPAAPEDAEGRARHRLMHVTLLQRVLATLESGGHFIYADAMRPRFRVVEHLDTLRDAGFVEVDAVHVIGRFVICGGQRP